MKNHNKFRSMKHSMAKHVTLLVGNDENEKNQNQPTYVHHFNLFIHFGAFIIVSFDYNYRFYLFQRCNDDIYIFTQCNKNDINGNSVKMRSFPVRFISLFKKFLLIEIYPIQY